MSSEETLVLIAHFSDLYCIENPQFWESLERKIMQKINFMKLESILTIMGHFGN